METVIKKNNDQIIFEAKKAFQGQWLNIFIASLPSILLGFGVFFTGGAIIESHKLNIFQLLIFIILAIVGNILVFLFQGRFWIWKNNYVLKKSRGEEVSLYDFRTIIAGFTSIDEIKASLLNKDQLIINLFPAITFLLSIVSILLGSLLLVIPGLIISLMLAFVPFIVVEDNSINPIDAVKKSVFMMDGYKMKLFLCYVKLIPLLILCLLPCGLGLFWFFPFLSFVLAKFYDAHK